MALKNRDLVFVVKIQNKARAALTQLKGDLRGIGAAGQAGVKGIDAQTAALDRLIKKAKETKRALDALSGAGSRSNSAAGTAGSGGSKGRNVAPDLSALTRAARAAATALERVARARAPNNRGGSGSSGGGGRGSNAANADLRSLASAARSAATALERVGRAHPPGAGGGGGGVTRPSGAGAGAAAGAAGGRLGLGTVIAAGTVLATAKAYGDLSDEYKNLYARVSLTTKGVDEQKTVFSEVTKIANSTRNGLDGTVTTYYRMAQAGKNLGLQQKQVYRATELVSKAVTISGASADAAKAALLQFGQGLGSGTLRGDELNSVLEQTPRLAEALAQGLGFKSTAALRAFAQQGKLTSEAVINALLSQGEALDREFAQFPVTIGQSMTVLRNNVLSVIGEIEQKTGATSGIAKGILQLGAAFADPQVRDGLAQLVRAVSDAFGFILATVASSIRFLAENMSTILPLVKGLAAGFAAFKLLSFVEGIMSAAKAMAFLNAIMAINPFILVATAVIAITTALFSARDQISATSDGLASLGDYMRAVWESILPILQKVWDFLASTLGPVFSYVAKQVGLISFSFADLVMFAAKVVDQIVSFFLGMYNVISTIISDVINLVSANFENIVAIIFPIPAAITKIFVTYAGEIAALTATIINAIRATDEASATASENAAKRAGKAQQAIKTAKINAPKGLLDYGNKLRTAYNAGKVTFAQDAARGLDRRARQIGADRRSKQQGDAPIAGIATDSTGTDPTAPDKGAKKAADEAKKAAKELQDALKSLQGTYDPLRASERDYNEELKKLAKAAALSDTQLKALGFTREDVTRITTRAKQVHAEEVDLFFKDNQAIAENARVLRQASSEREIERKIIEKENELKAKNVDITSAEVAAQLQLLRARLQTEQAQNAADKVNTDLTNAQQDADVQIKAMGLVGYAQERFIAVEQKRIDIMRQGGLTAVEAAAAAERFGLSMDKVRTAAQALASNLQGGLKAGLQDWVKTASDVYNVGADFTKNTLSNMTDTFATFLTEGKANFGDFARTVIADIGRVVAQLLILKGLKAVAGPLGLSGLFHSGGMVGQAASAVRAASPALWTAAPRFHKGSGTSIGAAMGLRKGERPIIALDEERVLSPKETRAYNAGQASIMGGLNKSNSGGGVTLSPNFNNQFLLGNGNNDNSSGMSDADMASMSKALEQETNKFMERWIAKEMRPGGRLDRSKRK